MKKSDDPSPDEREDHLRETIDLIRGVEPALAARIKNRKVIATELARIEQHTLSKPWWKRSVSVPMPVAMGFAAVVLVTTLAWLPRFGDAPVESEFATGAISIASEESAASIDTTSDIGESNEGPLDYEASETYLCGVGRIQYASVYRFREE